MLNANKEGETDKSKDTEKEEWTFDDFKKRGMYHYLHFCTLITNFYPRDVYCFTHIIFDSNLIFAIGD